MTAPCFNICVLRLHAPRAHHLWAPMIGAIVLAICMFLAPSPARADWYPACAGSPGCSTDYGADYQAAACADMQIVYGTTTCHPAGFLTNISSQIFEYQVTAPFGAFTLTAYAAIYCSGSQVPTANGCANEVDGQGGICPIKKPYSAASPDKNGVISTKDPCNISTGNVFENATDFATVGQNPLTARRYYNSDLHYAASAPQWHSGATPPANLHTFLYSRFGYGWRSEYDRFILPNNCSSNSCTPAGTTAVEAITADGTPVHFSLSGSTWYVSYWDFSSGSWSSSGDPRHDIYIRISTDGTYWYITDSNDTVDQYNANGQLLTITYRNGYQQTLTYDVNNNNTAVSDSAGRQITFAYLANGLASSMTDAAGNVTQYSYVDQSGVTPAPASGSAGLWVLQTVTYPDTTSITYSYTDSNPVNRFALTGITDEDGNAYAAWAYDGTSGRVTSNQLAGGADQTTFAYDDTAVTRTVTNALTKQTIYSLAGFQGVLQTSSAAGQASTHTPASTVSYAYDSNGFMQQVTSGEGRITQYTNNSIGQQTSETDGYGTAVARTISTTWDATYNLPDQIVEPNLTYNFTYTGGLLTQMVETDTTTTAIPYSTNGETRTWNYTYYTSGALTGMLQTVEGPLGAGDTVTYAYSTNAYSAYCLSAVTDQLGHVTTISSWNVWCEPLTSVDANGITTNYTYDLRARLKSVTVNPGASQAVTSFGYDNAGNLTSITEPDGASLTYGYDAAHRLTSVTDSLGDTITYTLDAMGDRTQTVVRDPGGTITKTQSATFDELARLLTSIGASSQTTAYGYDKDNNQVSLTDPRSKLYQYAFDALERVMQETDPDSYTTGLGYNGNDQVTSVTDARALSTSYVRDGFGDIIQQASPDTGTTVFWFDAHGNVTKKVDARSIETDMTYDALDRILTKTFPADTAENVAYAYDATAGGNDGIGYLTSVSDQSGSTAFVYNALGQVTADTRTIGSNAYGAGYTFDASGNPLTLTYPSGRIVTYTRDALGRVSGITTQQGSGAPVVAVLTGGTYEPFGGFSGGGFGDGSTVVLGYDQDYELTSLSASAGSVGIQSLSYSYDASSNILGITDNLNAARTQTLAYDDLNRVWCGSGAYGTQAYTYDGVGNRASLSTGGTIATCPTMSGGTTSTYAVASGANQIATITTGSNVRAFSYLASGQVSGDQRTATSDYTFGYNNDGRLTTASLNSAGVGSYLYNGFGQRVQKTVGSTVIDLVYDRSGHLLAEANDATGAPLREYVWMDDTPVAMVDDTGSSPAVYYIHTDQLGTPQKLTDASANIVWDGVFDPFGNAVAVGADWGAGIWDAFSWEPSSPPTMPLRFPGQYADAETGLNQNGFRDYDPTIGRYVESDPIGLDGGVNTYVYADQNSLVVTDPFGLCATDKKYCNNTLVNIGNWLEDFADKTGQVSLELEGGGLVITGAGALTAQPEVFGAGIAVTATGGAGGLFAGGLQTIGGLF